MHGWSVLIGVLLAGPVCIIATAWAIRRIYRDARRLSARAKGQERLIEVGQLVGGLAHEIKNPLSTINLNLKLLSEDLARRSDEISSRLARRLQAVQIEADRLKDILDDFLRYAGKHELSLAAADLRQLVQELIDFFSPQADASHVVLRCAMPDYPVTCLVDANLIKQAMLNLIINAMQAMPDGGELLLKLSAQREQAVIEVIDTGVGIAPGDMQKIFQAYYSTKKQGSGLGLPATRRIVQEHGGAISVESEPAQGTRFVIRLPLAKAKQARSRK